MVGETKQSVTTGSQITGRCGEIFGQIVGDVTSVSGMASEIASASAEQSRGVAEITKAMSQLDQMTQQNASTSEQCASAAEELSAQAQTLRSAVQELVHTVNGGGSHNVQEAAPVVASPRPRAAAPTSKANNVIRMKSPRREAAPQPARAVAGEAPRYDSAGFTDV